MTILCQNYCPNFQRQGECCLDEILPRPLDQIKLDDLGDDESLESHVSPACQVGGDQ